MAHAGPNWCLVPGISWESAAGRAASRAGFRTGVLFGTILGLSRSANCDLHPVARWAAGFVADAGAIPRLAREPRAHQPVAWPGVAARTARPAGAAVHGRHPANRRPARSGTGWLGPHASHARLPQRTRTDRALAAPERVRTFKEEWTGAAELPRALRLLWFTGRRHFGCLFLAGAPGGR